MTILTKPQGRIPIGWAVVNGERVPIIIDMEWDLYLTRLNERAGGVTGLGTTDVDAGYFAAMAPVVTPQADESMTLQTAPAQFDAPDVMQSASDVCLSDMIFQH